MTLEETKQKIMEDDSFVMAEFERIREMYRLKKVIRYGQGREIPASDTESVAEHIFGLYILADYFLPLDDPEGTMSREKIYRLITWHELDEVILGDTPTQLKTEEIESAGFDAAKQTIAALPDSLREEAQLLWEEHLAQTTPEAKFVKALDKLEPSFEVWGDNYKRILVEVRANYSNHWPVKEHYWKPYPCMWRFAKVKTDFALASGLLSPD